MNKKYKVVIVTLFSLLVTMLLVVQTYALFETNTSGDGNLDIGKWVILVNDNDVTLTRTLTLDNFVYANGTHTQANYFAPGSTVYFDLVIDASESDVSVEYQLDVDASDLEDYPNISFAVTDLDNNQSITTTTYNSLIRLSDANRVHHIRINLVWNNQAAYDESDTSLINSEFSFDITADFKQSIAE